LIELENAVVYHGSNLDVLPTLPDNSVDAIVTDPPYELGFMGKSWDSSGIAYSVELWAECLRVLKPGGHLLAFGGSRTWHRIAVAIEDAGFDVRDSIAWLYGSGFPKSLDISKAIDKRGGENITWFGAWLKKWREENNISQKEVAALFPSKTGNLTGCVANWELGFNLPTAEQFTLICRHFNLPFESLEEAEREVIGTKISGIANAEEKDRHTIGASKAVQVDITAPATDEAKKWQGWGTALKPAFEPIVVARKPLVSTVAANVLLWGVGGLNIDGSRIGTEQRDVTVTEKGFGSNFMDDGWQPSGNSYEKSVTGRWPANIILDEYTAGLLDEQSGVSKSTGGRIGKKDTSNIDFGLSGKYEKGDPGFGDVGGASRFFYVAKASKRDRNEGLENIEGQEIGAKGNGLARTCATCGATVLDGCQCPDRTYVNPTRQNFHPTVKPTALMEYLVKLVTPPGGVVLDPFTGSGSTGKAALLNGFKFIGIELTADYLPIIKGRLEFAAQTFQQQAKEKETKESETLF
jgi:DNA modification methylase